MVRMGQIKDIGVVATVDIVDLDGGYLTSITNATLGGGYLTSITNGTVKFSGFSTTAASGGFLTSLTDGTVKVSGGFATTAASGGFLTSLTDGTVKVSGGFSTFAASGGFITSLTLGTVYAWETMSSTPLYGITTIATTAITQLYSTSKTFLHGMQFKADDDNTDSVWVGTTGVATNVGGFRLKAGQGLTMELTNATLAYGICSTSATQIVWFCGT